MRAAAVCESSVALEVARRATVEGTPVPPLGRGNFRGVGPAALPVPDIDDPGRDRGGPDVDGDIKVCTAGALLTTSTFDSKANIPHSGRHSKYTRLLARDPQDGKGEGIM